MDWTFLVQLFSVVLAQWIALGTPKISTYLVLRNAVPVGYTKGTKNVQMTLSV